MLIKSIFEYKNLGNRQKNLPSPGQILTGPGQVLAGPRQWLACQVLDNTQPARFWTIPGCEDPKCDRIIPVSTHETITFIVLFVPQITYYKSIFYYLVLFCQVNN